MSPVPSLVLKDMEKKDPCPQRAHSGTKKSELSVRGESSSVGVVTENDFLEVLLGLPPLDAATMPMVRSLSQAVYVFGKGQLFQEVLLA